MNNEKRQGDGQEGNTKRSRLSIQHQRFYEIPEGSEGEPDAVLQFDDFDDLDDHIDEFDTLFSPPPLEPRDDPTEPKDEVKEEKYDFDDDFADCDAFIQNWDLDTAIARQTTNILKSPVKTAVPLPIPPQELSQKDLPSYTKISQLDQQNREKDGAIALLRSKVANMERELYQKKMEVQKLMLSERKQKEDSISRHTNEISALKAERSALEQEMREIDKSKVSLSKLLSVEKQRTRKLESQLRHLKVPNEQPLSIGTCTSSSDGKLLPQVPHQKTVLFKQIPHSEHVLSSFLIHSTKSTRQPFAQSQKSQFVEFLTRMTEKGFPIVLQLKFFMQALKSSDASQ